MANFTAIGNGIDADDILLFPWMHMNFDQRDGAERQETNTNWEAEVHHIGHSNLGSDVSSPEISLAHLHHDLLILGHGNYGDRIQKDAGYTHSARSLARLLEKRGLPKAFAGKVILWSCFGGAAGGMAQSLAFKLSCRGYTNVQVWGCRWITGTIVNRVLLCRRNTTPDNIAGVDVAAAVQDMIRY